MTTQSESNKQVTPHHIESVESSTGIQREPCAQVQQCECISEDVLSGLAVICCYFMTTMRCSNYNVKGLQDSNYGVLAALSFVGEKTFGSGYKPWSIERCHDGGVIAYHLVDVASPTRASFAEAHVDDGRDRDVEGFMPSFVAKAIECGFMPESCRMKQQDGESCLEWK